MKLTLFSLATVTFLTIAVAGCGSSTDNQEAAAGGGMAGMPGMPQTTPATAEHVAEGTLNSVDAAAGTVNISHGPVASASWPAMTMSFKLAEPSAVADLTPGQRVKFQFTIQSGMSATVTEISPGE